MEKSKCGELKKARIESSDFSKNNILELITLDGHISKKAIFNQEDEICDLMSSCSGVFFYKISKGGDVWKSGRIVL